MNTEPLLQSKTFKGILLGIGILVVLLVVFQAGELVGFRKASFSYRWGEHYYRDFAGPRQGGFMGMGMGLGGKDYLTGYGTFGSILKVATSTLVVQDPSNAEKVILVSKDTVIKQLHDTVPLNELKENDRVVVIGSPNNAGQIEAKFIRVLPSSQSLPSTQGTPHP